MDNTLAIQIINGYIILYNYKCELFCPYLLVTDIDNHGGILLRWATHWMKNNGDKELWVKLRNDINRLNNIYVKNYIIALLKQHTQHPDFIKLYQLTNA